MSGCAGNPYERALMVQAGVMSQRALGCLPVGRGAGRLTLQQVFAHLRHRKNNRRVRWCARSIVAFRGQEICNKRSKVIHLHGTHTRHVTRGCGSYNFKLADRACVNQLILLTSNRFRFTCWTLPSKCKIQIIDIMNTRQFNPELVTVCKFNQLYFEA